MFEHVFTQRLRRWGVRGVMAVLDQGVFSGSNFVVSILLARWLSPDKYGTYALALATYLFLSGFHNALILEPMSVLATSNYADDLRVYLPSQLVLHGVATGLLATLTLVVVEALILLHVGISNVAGAVLAVAIFLPALLLVWLVRRIFYILQRPGRALGASVVYSACLFAGALILHSRPEGREVFWWIGLMGLASVLASCTLLSSKYLGTLPSWQRVWGIFRGDQWRLGRSLMVATLLYSLGTQIQVFAAASFLGLEATGALRAVQNLTLPMSQIVVAVATLTMPAIAADFGRRDFLGLRSNALRVGAMLTLIGLGYEAGLLIGAKWIAQILYGDQFAQFIWLVPLAGIAPLVSTLETGFSLILRSLQRPAFYLIDKSVTAVVGGISAVVCVAHWAVTGAIWSLILVEFGALVTYLWLYRRWFVPRLATSPT